MAVMSDTADILVDINRSAGKLPDGRRPGGAADLLLVQVVGAVRRAETLIGAA